MMRLSLRTKLILLLLGVLSLAVIAWGTQTERLTSVMRHSIEADIKAEHQRLLLTELGRKRSYIELLVLLLRQKRPALIGNFLEPVLLDRAILWIGQRASDGRWSQWPVPESSAFLHRLQRRSAPDRSHQSFPSLFCSGPQCGLLYRFQAPCSHADAVCEVYVWQALDVFLADYYSLANSDILLRIQTDAGARVLGTHLHRYPQLVTQIKRGSMGVRSGHAMLWPASGHDANWLVQQVDPPPKWDNVAVYVITDVSAFERFFAQLRWEMLTGVLGLGLLIFIALYLGLRRLISHLEGLEQALAALAKQHFDAAVKMLKRLRHSSVRDEVDDLVDEALLATKEQQRLHAKLSYLAYHDELTGLQNRRAFMDEVKSLLTHPGLLIMTDLDRFKQINDLYGHAAGDLALKAIARRLQQFVEQWPGSVPYRLAGDEFVIWMPLSQGKAVEPRLDALKQIMDGAFTGPEGERIYLEGSLGAVRVPEHAREPEAALRKADKALYIAKQEDNVRGWHLFDPLHDEDTEVTLQEHAILDHVRDALAGDAFRLVYQPILNIHAQRISHYEVLLRLDDAKGQPISPAVFIPIAERHGLSARIDEWVFRQVVLKLQHTPEQVHLAVNFSAATVQRRDLASWVLGQLQEKGVAPERLLVELTETAYVTNVRQARENLAALQAAGVRVALDDFGVGHASFNYITQLPLDLVKLDGSYVRDMVENRRHQALVKGITEIVHAWGLQVVAEYVEDGRILSLLAAAGVDFAQGYQIGKPATDIASDNPQRLSS